jgi:hypothetical protein
VKPIGGETCERTWLNAAEHLASLKGSYTEYNLVVEIEHPTVHGPADHRVRKVVDDFLRAKRANPISTVAGTIFPAAEYLDHGVRGVYETYPDEVFPSIRSGGEWGRYAHRLVRWPVGPGKEMNPLKTLVDKMKSQLRNAGPMRACYELSLSDSGIDLPLYDPARDSRRTRNGPCLSHVSLKLGEANDLYLTALYRSHSYIARALGNFLGLAALQAFVCEQTGLEPGPLMCVSTYARLEEGEKSSPWSKSDAIRMVRRASTALRSKK